jgi:hypothetical protein
LQRGSQKKVGLITLAKNGIEGRKARDREKIEMSWLKLELMSE